ncbi:MAG: DUF4091 domain-containing protein, partial [Planctomycetota bacterium]|nr:DUF4091 domain-containing protein [Planctomycetota bacterium]
MAIDVNVNAPKRKTGAQLERVELREAIYLTTEIPSGYKAYPVGQWPDPLFLAGWEKKIPNAPVTRANVDVFKKTKRRTFWLVMKAPRNGEPGIYRGSIELRLHGEPAAEFSVEVQVDAFSLSKRAHLRCCTGMVGWKGLRSNMAIMGIPKEEIDAFIKEKHDMDRYRELILEYGWSPTMWSGLKVWQKYYDYGRGMSVFTGGRGTPQDMAWLKERGLLEYSFIYAPFDEHPDARVPEVVEWCRKWKAKSEIPILDCYYGRNVEPLFGLVDIWLGQNPRQEWAQERKKKGDRFFGVNASLVWYIEFEPVNGRTLFWKDFISGVDGRYVYSTCRWTADVYRKNWTSGNYMGCAVYPSPFGIATSIRFETLRFGIEYYDYLAILRYAFNKIKNAGPAAVTEEAQATI